MGKLFQMKFLFSRFYYGLLVFWVFWVLVEAKYRGKLERRDPDNNPLGLKANYRVAWIDTTTGQFGGNLTLSLPATTPLGPYWNMKFVFADQHTKIDEYWGEWSLEKYKSGSYVILPVKGSDSLVESYCFNAQFSINGKLDTASIAGLIMPTSYTLILKPDGGPEQEVLLSDYTNTPLDLNIPATPFGPYIRVSPPQFNADPSTQDINDFGDGTTFQATPVGLYIYGLVFFIGAGIVGAGTCRRSQYRADFRSQLATLK
ncbi:hypothetical protein K7432_001597 [Basidiobolus ranarum]|uniref:Uncharacterized protein n=1 Tax=Basidiobolus ranarum TaxID=34480 RepID=A0ABR2X2P8_9FUNG